VRWAAVMESEQKGSWEVLHKMNMRILMMTAAVVVGMGVGWVLPAQQAPAAASGPQWKSTKEYDEAQEYTKAKSDPDRVKALDQWSKDFPDTEVWQAREESYLTVYGQMKDYRKVFDRAKAIRAAHPDYYFGISSILSYVVALNPVQPDDLTVAEQTAQYVLANSAKIFDASNKPISMPEADWPKVKEPVLKLAQRTIAWVAFTRKDWPKAEEELTKVIKDDPTQAQASYQLGSSLFNQKDKDVKKIPPAIFHLARGASYAGQNALAQATRTAALNSVTSIYTQYHGSKDGLEPLLELAKNNAFPPADFKIKSITEIEGDKYANQEAFDKEHPDLAFWRDAIKTPLSGANATMVFDDSYKGTLLPPAPPAATFGMFKMKIVSMTPETNPKEIVGALADPNIPDVKLVFPNPLGGTMMPGAELQFKGVAQAFQKDPFMVTFEIDSETDGKLEGWTGGPPPKATKQAPKNNTKNKSKTKGK